MSEDGEFREVFPALSKELEEESTKTFKIDGVRTMAEETDSTRDAKTFTPDVVDYIRRCDTVSQALEIVDFLMKQKICNKLASYSSRARASLRLSNTLSRTSRIRSSMRLSCKLYV